jgi:conjugative relaxase-like TrwC/TraI family protein
VGGGSAGLGLVGPVRSDQLVAVLAGCRPGSERPLTDRTGVRTVAYDLTFTAPKSVSLLGALGEPPHRSAVARAHRAAVGSALDYVAARGAAARRSEGGERHLVATDGLVAAAFEHRLSRAEEPHCHTHVVVANVAHGDDGRWSALDGRGLYAHARAAGALYRAELRHRLTEELGVRWRRAPGGYELEGVDSVLLGDFSGRRAEIAQALGTGPVGRRARHVAWATTRQEKGRTDPADVEDRWHRRLEGLGLGPTVAPVRTPPARPHLDEGRFAAELARAGPAPTRRDAVAAWADALVAGAPAVQVTQAVARWLPPGVDGPGVAERRLAPRWLVPSPAAVAELGPRPVDPGGQGSWRRAAAALDHYRDRWGLGGPGVTAPGTDRLGPLAAMPAGQLAERVLLARQLDDVRRQLGRSAPAEWSGPERGLGR